MNLLSAAEAMYVLENICAMLLELLTAHYGGEF
jgi:hypothetical protein